MTTYNNVLDVFSYAAHTLANTLWSERAFNGFRFQSSSIHTLMKKVKLDDYAYGMSSYFIFLHISLGKGTIYSVNREVYRPQWFN